VRLRALSEREFRLLFVGQSLSLVGDGMVNVALPFAVLDLTGSVTDLGFVFAGFTLPWSHSSSSAASSPTASSSAA
jgi:hypothetical protein